MGEIISYAYGLLWDDQVVGLPENLGAYHIDAKTPAPSTTQQERLMLRDVLAQRFGLVCHWEKRIGAGYVLTVSDTRHLRPSTDEGDSSDRMLASRDGGLH